MLVLSHKCFSFYHDYNACDVCYFILMSQWWSCNEKFSFTHICLYLVCVSTIAKGYHISRKINTRELLVLSLFSSMYASDRTGFSVLQSR